MTKSSARSPSLFNDTSLLFEWASHDDDSYHDFSPEEAEKIRSSLLTWYHANRRKLPWRGDPPPYDGSTAGINTAAGNKKRKVKKEETGQKSIKNFFASNGSATPEKEELSNIDELAMPDPEETDAPRLQVSAYGVWVSEIMLQQTRVEAVIPYYLKWMAKFPTVQHLANATEDEVNAHWAGLGFYRRARFLHQGAQFVVETCDGELPPTVEELMKISGIGQYTASAVSSIAFNQCVPVVDGNVCRVLSRLRGIAHHIKAPILKDKLGWRLAEQIVQAGDGKDAGEVNQALMELGATYCAPGGTGLDDNDPLKEFYLSTKLAENFKEERTSLGRDHGYENFPVDLYLEATRSKKTKKKACVLCDNKASVLTEWNDIWTQGPFVSSHGPFPLAPPKASKREEVLAVAVLRSIQDDKWLLVKRPKKGLLAGQWEFPSVCVWSSADDKSTKGKKKRKEVEIPFIKETIRSKTLTKYLDSLAADAEESFIPPSTKRTILQESVDHIFSHVRHTMWIEHQKVRTGSMETTSWISGEGKEVRWMSKEDMEKVGVTSGVKKVLAAVEAKSSGKKRSKRK